MIELFTTVRTEGERRRKRLKNLILPERAKEAHYLCDEIATYSSNRKEAEANSTEDMRK